VIRPPLDPIVAGRPDHRAACIHKDEALRDAAGLVSHQLAE
jgi:hypothetical protein